MNRNLKQIIIWLLFFTLVIGQENKQTKSEFGKKHQQQQAFLNFKNLYAKKYDSVEHEQYRFNIFLENLKEIERLNAEITSAQFGVNQFSDFAQEEFVKLFTGAVIPNNIDQSVPLQNASEPNERNLQSIPTNWDIRVNGPGQMQPVKNQGGCGSDWAFTVTATVENLYKIKYNYNLQFSEQQQVDCTYQRDGCQGGWFTDAYQFVINTGLALENSYSYTGVYGTCRTSQMGIYLYKISGFQNLANDQQIIKQAIVSKGAAAVCVDATYWRQYASGIYSDSRASTTTCNHAATIIGYGPGYWLIRNSWGKSWGEQGHIRVASDGSGGIRTQYVFQPY
ncbi:hypothetical protein ABPG74_018399 [Tetrahymena malaccensis]